MNKEPMKGRPYKNVDKSKVPLGHSMCWKCGKIVPDRKTVLYQGEADKEFAGCWDIADFLCKSCDKVENKSRMMTKNELIIYITLLSALLVSYILWKM